MIDIQLFLSLCGDDGVRWNDGLQDMAETLSAIWYELGVFALVIVAGLAALLKVSRNSDA
jgi:hypothetical protein